MLTSPQAYDEIGENSLPYTRKLSHMLLSFFVSSGPISDVRRSPRKTERRPVYVLNLTIPPRYVDNCLEPSKTSVHLQVLSSFVWITSRANPGPIFHDFQEQ